MNFILRDENAIYYECGFSCDNVIFLSFGKESFFITDSRYTLEAKEHVKDAEVIQGDRKDLFITVKEYIKKAKQKQIIFNPAEWSVQAFSKLQEGLEDVEFKEELNFSLNKRIIKSQSELALLQKASSLGKEAFDTFAAYLQKNGLGESEQRLHFEAEAIFKKMGELELSFSPIVALGRNAAKPHALATADCLKQGELVLVDAGVKYKRYCSDRTRVAMMHEDIGFQKEQYFSDKEQQKVYDIVLKAQEAGIKAIKPGIKACDVDRACREVISKEGYGDFFVHSTGHGVGLDIHELPIISSKSQTQLEEGMIFTVEPGIYLAERFGVRIEDTVIVTSSGAKLIGQ